MENITLKEIIFNIKNLRQAGRVSQDTILSDEQYLFIINQYRATLVGRDLDRRKAIAPQLEQTIKAKFERVRSMEQDIFADLRVYKALVPSVVQSSTRPLYQGVRTGLLNVSMPRSTSTRIRYDLHSPITRNLARYFPIAEELYVVTPDPLQELFVSAVFYNPFLVWKESPKFDPFDPYNFNYAIDGSTLDPLYKMMTDAEIKLSMISPNDISADGKEEPYVQRSSGRQQQQPIQSSQEAD